MNKPRKSLPTILALLVVSLALMLSPSLNAEDYHMSPSGNDTFPGTLAQPWKTFTHSTTQLAPGDTLILRSGTYTERLVLNGKNGTLIDPVIIRNYNDETAIIDGSTLTIPDGGRAGLVVLKNCNHIHIHGLEIRNFETSSSAITPVGIQIEGSGSDIQVTGCKVHHIYQNNKTLNGNGFGISVYGTSVKPITGLLLKENEIYDLRTGQSESVVINGNVTEFIVTRNTVHHCNNIGIDFIGYEGSAPSAVDRARNGVCSENIVYQIDSAFNPGYGGDFTTGGGDESAAGIYVDGGTNITVERNHVYKCNFGIELASEYSAGFTENIQLINNLLHHNYGPGLIMGGYDSQRGKTRFCVVRNNTLFRNDTRQSFGGQIALQFYLENNQFKNNIIWADSNTKQMIVHYVEGGNASKRAFPIGNTFDYNVYFCEGAEGDIEFGLNPTGNGGSQGNKSYNGLAAWRSIVGSDSHSSFINPGFVTPVPTITPSAGDFQITTGSPCVNLGEPSPAYSPMLGEKDFFGSSRVANNRVDVGFYEFLNKLQSWRDIHFELPDGGLGANDNDDPDGDTVVNLVEYSQGMDPNLSDFHKAPSGASDEDFFRYIYLKDAPDLEYDILQSSNLTAWEPTLLTEKTDGNGTFWRDTPLTTGGEFFRLKVSY